MSKIIRKATRDKDAGTKYVLFILSPLISLIYSIKNSNSKSSYIVFFLFALFFGFAFEIENATTIDGYRYVELFQAFASSAYDIKKNFVEWLSFGADDKDFYLQTICYIVSAFTSNYHFLFLALAAVFSFFQLKSLKFLTNSPSFKNDFYSISLIIVFIGANQIFNINGARFWTAVWVAIYCLFELLYNNNRKYLLLLLVLPFFHAAFLLFPLLYAVYWLTKSFGKLWIILFIISFFLGNISNIFFQNMSNYLPDTLQMFNERYTSVEAFEENIEREKSLSLLYILTSNMSNLYVGALVIIINKYIDRIKHSAYYNLYIFLLVLSTFANVTMPIPSLGGRFILMTYPLLAFLCLNILSKQKFIYLIYLAPVAMVNILYQFYIHYLMVVPMPDFLITPFVTIFKHIFI